jgi:hypothetical protein
MMVCFLIVGVGTIGLFWFTKWNLSMLRQVPALSYATVDLVWCYAWTVTALTLLLLLALTLAICMIEYALKCSRC